MKPRLNGVVGIGFIFVSGGCIGFLAGLSVSPVAEPLVTSVAALVITLTTALAGLNQTKSSDEPSTTVNQSGIRVAANPIPIGVLVLGITLGVVCGILTRTHDLLGTSQRSKQVQTEKAESTQSKVETGIEIHKISPAIPSPPKDTSQNDNFVKGVLYQGSTSDCEVWRGISSSEALRQNLRQAEVIHHKPGFAQIVDGCRDSMCLKGVVQSLCGD